MAVNVQLRDLIRGVRAETGKSLNVALGVAERDAIVYQLQSKQEWLYYEYDWPYLLHEFQIPIVAGTRAYPYPAGLAFDFINDVWVSETLSTGYTELGYGVGPTEFNIIPNGVLGWPVQKWFVDIPGEIAIWPNPSKAGWLSLWGRRALTPLVDDTDVSTLDGTLIVLHVAADILARQKAEDAKLKLSQAQKHQRNIARRGNANKRSPFVLGGGRAGLAQSMLRPGIDYIPS